MKTVSVVVPVYFNEGSLAALFEELLKVEAQLAERACTLELIFVDDGSGDDSLKLLLELRERRAGTKIIKLTRNFGAVHASKAGLRFVSGDCFLWLAADLQDPPGLIPDMVDRWLDGAKYVIAARTARHDPTLTKLYARIYYAIVRLFVLKDYPRGGFDLLLMDKTLLPHLRDSSKNTNTELLSYWLGIVPVVIGYERQARIHGKSRWTFAKRLTYFIDSILSFSVLPIRLISLIGIVVSLLSFGYGSFIFVEALCGVRDVPGFPAVVALITFLLGLIIVMLGIIGEYIWRIFDEVTRRPEVVIDEVYS
ncbi:MAG: glycosyltransferase [Chloroflexi bacterium]|nr:glycosyltransferase [Chloroflexota bacterium]